jgi:hypothetical protein
MPIYTFEHPETGDIIEIIQSMNDKHEYFGEDGVKYKRVYYSPNMAIDSQISAFSSKDFVEKTKNKKGTIGDLLDKSKELSEKRGGENSDPVLKNFYSSYEKDNGIKHSNQIKSEKLESANNKLKKFGISIEK